MKHLNFLALNDAYYQEITFDDIEPVELGSAYENLLEPLSSGRTATVRRGTGYTASGEIGGKRAVFTIRDEGVPIAVIGVCLHSRSSPQLWRELYHGEALPDLLPPAAPWVAVRYEVAETVIPPWLDRLAWHAAWYLAEEQKND
ncbi:hypothetical protein HA052_19880 [Chromobacterium haemolyticum]|uniref:ASCH domain-containing protein n=1 Tax=Chromobacterium fluminis TaxID=3044269 RepID=A0ABX0LG97_9NEIS|nr:hypothetical protein [Chromobacterium haemolyticum]NHR07455.1 hypothetical protein [Chromobacterium haemolyticum]